jgi:Histidine kinase-, DNA gyrase B-, and HSP90-like ATPase
MPEKHFTVKVESDHIKKLTAAKPIPALAELIWNAGDADATRIDVEIETNDLGMHSIIVRDDGHGIPHGEIEHLFGKLGGSPTTRRSTIMVGRAPPQLNSIVNLNAGAAG